MVNQIRSHQIKDAEGVKRADLDVTNSGDAVVAKLVAGTNVSFTETGPDAGTGDVTINVASGGDVVGPGSSTDEALARFDGTGGKTLQNNASATCSDAGVISATGFEITS